MYRRLYSLYSLYIAIHQGFHTASYTAAAQPDAGPLTINQLDKGHGGQQHPSQMCPMAWHGLGRSGSCSHQCRTAPRVAATTTNHALYSRPYTAPYTVKWQMYSLYIPRSSSHASCIAIQPIQPIQPIQLYSYTAYTVYISIQLPSGVLAAGEVFHSLLCGCCCFLCSPKVHFSRRP